MERRHLAQVGATSRSLISDLKRDDLSRESEQSQRRRVAEPISGVLRTGTLPGTVARVT
jgi:hypothetical protein